MFKYSLESLVMMGELTALEDAQALSQKLLVRNFNLGLTLASGQFFRYHDTHDGCLLLTQGRAVRVAQRGNALLFSGADELFVRHLFQLTPEYARAIVRLRQDPVLVPMLAEYRGLRVMRQDLHETIIGFICSSQSNIPKIRMNLHLLANTAGVVIDGHAHLPEAGTALDTSVVLAARTGYRAKFIVATNKMLTPDFLARVKAADYPTSHVLLCSLPGVGPKIADCVCLFALGHGEAFPVDVHVLRAMKTLFPRARLDNEQKAKHYAQKRWGTDAGLAQQFIFQWARDNLRADARHQVRA